MPNFGGGNGNGEGRGGHPAGSGGSGSTGGHRVAFGVPPRRTRVLAITLAVLVVLIAVFLLVDSVYTAYLWYRSVGVAHVYRTRMVTQAVLFLVFGALMAVVVGANVWLAHRFRPPLTGVSVEQQALDRYRMALGPFLAWILAGVSLFVGVVAGAAATGAWRTYLLWADAVPFGTEDPQFHKDIGFYVFTLPWLRHIQGFLLAAVVLSLIAALLTHYLFAGVALTPPTGSRPSGRIIGSRATRAAQVHISILLGLLVLVKAYAYWLDRYALTVASSSITGGWSGPTYKSVHAVLPAKSILLVIAILCAVLFFANAARLIATRNQPEIDRGGHPWALPALGVSLMVLAAVVIGGVYPLVVQQLQVNPSQGTKEAPYIQKNIDATRTAYGLDGVEVRSYDAKTDATRDQLAADAGTVTQIRIMDPSVISATYDQQQQVRGFYTFPDDLAVDRYPIDGKAQDTVVAVRQLKLSGVPADQRNWVNDHLKYTHGYGVVAAKGNAASPEGSPDYVEHNLPATGALGAYEQRVYFSAGLPDYSIVGGTAQSTPAEFDYPGELTQQTTTYDGKGGVPVGSFLNKLLYSVKFQDPKILLSNGVNADSRILYDRDPKQRVQAVAPWLTIDGTTYPVVVGGRIKWVVDGYTTTAAYPYSTSTQLEDVAKDSHADSARDPLNAGRVNYVRNSVKATVDAYDGTVTLYAWDEADPILKAWMKAFPGTVKPRSAIAPDLLSHLRYPQDLFKAQRDILGRYHVTDPQEFFGGSSFWSVPNDPTKDTAQAQPPYYLTLQMPGQSAPVFSLTSTMVPTKRSNLAAFVAVDSDPGPDYGRIRVLELPTSSAIRGPEQIQNSFHNTFVDKLNLLRTGGATKVIEGNLLTLPVGNGLLYVEPVYVQPQNAKTAYPLLKSVLVAFGDKMAFQPTLQEGFDEVFAGSAGAQLKATLDAAAKAQDDAAAALAKSPPDWKAFGEAQQRLQDALATARSLEAGQQPK
ncbi:MAG: UPF0182 family protein [Catenulispora sp.]|nr:UPF0182 family protein [Catenulispora sp.]